MYSPLFGCDFAPWAHKDRQVSRQVEMSRVNTLLSATHPGRPFTFGGRVNFLNGLLYFLAEDLCSRLRAQGNYTMHYVFSIHKQTAHFQAWLF